MPLLSQHLLSLILLIGSLGLSAILFLAGLPFFFLFLFIPLIPLLSGNGSDGNGDATGGEQIPKIKECPSCGWQTEGDERYCPYCAAILIEKRK